ncbi:hypothetical protein ROHU_036753 [Labeo rohita]|uniref:Uncharacterized protein n=1 Tax=Labeo rohita TaxID=84645 RepID=A0A498MZY1_LABRO|nr:hypothetical protein ROHU_036753 [Labeo rohita]
MKRAQRRDILGELFLSHEGSDGGVDVRLFVVQPQQACQPECVCVCVNIYSICTCHTRWHTCSCQSGEAQSGLDVMRPTGVAGVKG